MKQTLALLVLVIVVLIAGSTPVIPLNATWEINGRVLKFDNLIAYEIGEPSVYHVSDNLTCMVREDRLTNDHAVMIAVYRECTDHSLDVLHIWDVATGEMIDF